MTRGHVLVATRGHRVKIAELEGGEGGAVGTFPSCPLYILEAGERAICSAVEPVWVK
jgi:hypothetical protein